MKSATQSNIKVSGGLLSEHFIRLMKEGTSSFIFAQPAEFVVPYSEDQNQLSKQKYESDVEQAWAALKERWDKYGRRKLTRMDPLEASHLWTKPLLKALGFEPTPLYRPIELSERLKLKLSHKGWGPNPKHHNPPITHIVAPSQSLDARTGSAEPSPHDAVQEYLNRRDDLWAVLTNGLYLRVLRDYHHTYVKGYVEFDLEAIFIFRSFQDFQALYRIAHASRFTSADTGNLYLEEYFRHSQLVGEKVGAKLRENVAKAVTSLGNGFLDQDLLAELQADTSKCQFFYEEILRIIYRIIFLLYAEQRGMLSSADESLNQQLYVEEYSISALRERALRRSHHADRHTDHWIGLRTTFELVRRGAPELGVYPYGGALFDVNRDEYVSRHTCKNSDLLEAIYFLTTTEMDGAIHRVSYADIDVEEIGAIYESLLDNTPRVTLTAVSIGGTDYPANSFILDPRATIRKTSGSYYTHQALIQELIKSALEPVIEDRLHNATQSVAAKERVLLSVKVCDPACGSGAFLIAACNRLAIELARVRAADAVVTESDVQLARRDVLQHCIYGVDLNAMAIELVKVSLWINALVQDKPLNFLDHHLRCGNSLIGATKQLIEQGIRSEAFEQSEGDDRSCAQNVKKRNSRELLNASLAGWLDTAPTQFPSDRSFGALSEDPEGSPEAVAEKDEQYHKLTSSDAYNDAKLFSDLWTSSFFWLLARNERELPTQRMLESLLMHGQNSLSSEFLAEVHRLTREYSFFHWTLEFPEVFGTQDPGFDCILGNPPWESVELREREFFKYSSPIIASTTSAAKRKKKISALAIDDPKLFAQFKRAKRRAECESKFLRNSLRYPLAGKGNVNTYWIFTELAAQAICSTGRAGLIIPSGIGTDSRTASLFRTIVENRQLVSLLDFENRKKFFPIDSRYKFCLLTLSGVRNPVSRFRLSFYLQDVKDISDPEKLIELSKAEINLVNPNTHTCPVYRNKRDASVITSIYKKIPLLYDRSNSDNSLVTVRQGLFHMAHDSALFKTQRALINDGYVLDGTRFRKKERTYIPLYEGKMMWIYNHRLSSATEEYKLGQQEAARETEFTSVETDKLEDWTYHITPRYWVDQKLVLERMERIGPTQYVLAYRGITNATNERTTISSFIPSGATGHSLQLVLCDEGDPRERALFLANINSIVFDYVVRQKIGTTFLSRFIFEQLPVLPFSAYHTELVDLISAKVLELTYTSWDLWEFAKDVGYVDEHDQPRQPFRWQESDRAHLQAELDAIYAHLYDISHDDLDYILETFPIMKRNDEQKYGTFRTKELVLHYYDEYFGRITPVIKEV